MKSSPESLPESTESSQITLIHVFPCKVQDDPQDNIHSESQNSKNVLWCKNGPNHQMSSFDQNQDHCCQHWHRSNQQEILHATREVDGTQDLTCKDITDNQYARDRIHFLEPHERCIPIYCIECILLTKCKIKVLSDKKGDQRMME
jgi:hypothetical protein